MAVKRRVGFVLLVSVVFAVSVAGQTSAEFGASISVPPVIQFSNIASDETGAPLSGTVPITFSLYNNSHGGSALWSETQSVSLDSSGHYSVYLGITQTNGIPVSLFTNGQADWLGVKIAGQPEQQPRIFLVSVPYAMKAGDAATVGGLPPSAFVLAASPNVNSASTSGNAGNIPASPETSSDVTTSGGTADFIPLWDTTTDITSSVISQSGSGSTAKIGINNSTPASTLDVKGNTTIRGAMSVAGTLQLPATGAATSSSGKNSQPLTQTASAYNSSTSAAVNQTFQWQAEPAGNDTPSPSATLNLLFGEGVAPTETGLHIASNGQITFASGQVFPGTGGGTVTSVGSGTGLTGGPVTSSGTLQIDPTVVPELGAASNTFTGSITANSFTGNGAGLTNVNAATLGGFTASAFQPAGSYATLGANTFTGTQTVTTGDLSLSSGNLDLSATGVIKIGGSPFAFGNPYNSGNNTGGNVFLGFAGNAGTTGAANTASGTGALFSNTTGDDNTAAGGNALFSTTTGDSNTASGPSALFSNTTGNYNVASGPLALVFNTTGSYNVGVGFEAGYPTNELSTTGSANTFIGSGTSPGANLTITNATAIGASAEVTQNNSLVLGSINKVNGATANVNVGIGTTAPAATLDVEAPSGSTPTINFGSTSNNASLTVNGTGNFTGNVTFASTQKFPGTGTVTSVGSGAGLTGGPITGSGTLSIATGGVSNAMLANSAVSVLPGTGLTGGGAVQLGQSTTLSVNLTQVPLLGSVNNFTTTQTFSGNVGIGTTGPAAPLDVEVNSAAPNTPQVLWLKNDAPLSSQTPGNSVDIRFTPDGGGAVATPNAYIRAQEDGGLIKSYGTSLQFATVANGNSGASERMRITSNGFVGIGTTTPGSLLQVEGGIPTPSASNYALQVVGASASSGSGDSGITGAQVQGGSGDTSTGHPGGVGVIGLGGAGLDAGNGVDGTGGDGTVDDGIGGAFQGGESSLFGDGVSGDAGTGYAGNFIGNLNVTGAIFAGTKDFKIDHPLDPANKYLVHASVESSEMMDIYTGNVVTDVNGEATVHLPEWFEALNRDFRYQLTVIGQFAMAIVAQEIQNHQFLIRTNQSHVKVSWQVTAVRQDAYARAHPLVVEEEKDARLKGFYIHPELYGAPEGKQIEWARHPQMMQRMKEHRNKQAAAKTVASAALSAPR
jgi:trimeric autotransporter adhesin